MFDNLQTSTSPSGVPTSVAEETHETLETGPDGEVVSSQTISSKTRTVETITVKD